jgi:hypothetical protein
MGKRKIAADILMFSQLVDTFTRHLCFNTGIPETSVRMSYNFRIHPRICLLLEFKKELAQR